MDWKFILALFVIPFKFVGKLFKSKIGVILVIVLAVIIFISTRPSGNVTATKPYSENIPSVKAAPTLIETSSRVYYAQKYSDDGKVITLQVFYGFDKDKWTKYNTPLLLDRAVYGQVRITPRTP